MLLLTVATSGPQGSLALAKFESQHLVSENQVEWQKKAMHSELATTQLQQLLSQSGYELKDLTHVSASIGPGSFTGIRVGVNLARTLAYGLGLPASSHNTLELLAFKNLSIGERGIIAIKAVQHYYYTAVYERQDEGLVEHLPPTSVAKNDLASHAVGCTKVLIEGESTPFNTEIEARDLVQWRLKWPDSPHFFSWKELQPLYVRASEAEEKMRQGLLKPL